MKNLILFNYFLGRFFSIFYILLLCNAATVKSDMNDYLSNSVHMAENVAALKHGLGLTNPEISSP